MTALLVLFMFVGFVLLDIAVREVRDRRLEARLRREREAALDSPVRLEFNEDAPTLKRVEVPGARARILAVDDEPVVLDSFRKILVLAGFSVDTVSTGPEALGLVRRNDYDFVFTDLKMPGMDGVEVVRAVRHLRPDIDVAVITGYGSIETAVETLKHGAVDYVQKPFTEDELTAFAGRLQVRRRERLEADRRPAVRIASLAAADVAPPHEYSVPGGAFVSEGHVWLRIEGDGTVRLGLDDFLRKALVKVDTAQPAAKGSRVKVGEPLVHLRRGGETIALGAPLGGEIVAVNEEVSDHPGVLLSSPYEDGWICLLRPADLAQDLASLRIGRAVVAWYQDEIARFRDKVREAGPEGVSWAFIEEQFLRKEAVAAR